MSTGLRDAVFRTAHWLRPGDDLLARMRAAEAYQWVAREVQIEQAGAALVALLGHARANVPYYRDLLPDDAESAVRATPDGIRIDSLPVLDKSMIRSAGSRMRSVDPSDRGRPNATSGSTGESLRFFLDAGSAGMRAATTFRCHRWAGIGPVDRQAKLWGARFDAPHAGIRHSLRNWLQPTLFLSSYELSDDSMQKYARELASFRPALLVSYPGPLEHFARYCREHGVEIPGLRAIVCSAEQLHAHQRSLIEEVFARPVFDRYGSREFANVAQECECHDGLHVATDHVFLEILDQQGAPVSGSRMGEVVITDLHNRAMPFIRYRTGDLARWQEGSCACGRTLPRIAALEGRVLELIRAPGGEVISGTFWPQVVKQASPRVRLYQVVQSEIAGVEIRLVLDPPGTLSDAEESALRNRIRQQAPTLGVEIRYVNDVPLTPGGKRRTVIGIGSMP